MVERERRAHPRKLVSTGVSFNDIEGATLRGWLHDISRGGCFVATPSIFTFGEELTIVLTLPFPRQRVQGRVRVAWVREKNDKDMPAGMGLEFVEVNADALVAIDKLATTPKLSRPKTVIGIAPPAVGSSPSYSDVQIPLPTPEDLAKGLPPPGLDAGLTEPEGVPIVQLPETKAETKDEPKPAEAEAAATEPTAPPLLPPVLAPAQEPKKGGREKLLIGGAAAVSVAGLVALGVVFSRHGKETPAVDAAPTASESAVVVVDATPAVVDTTPVVVPTVTTPPPIVDAAAEAATRDAGPHDAGADGGKKKPGKKIKRK